MGIDIQRGASGAGVTLAGTPDYITISDQVITRGSVVLTTDVGGTLPIANGGTNATDAGAALTSLGAAALGANSDITSITGLTTDLTVAQGGTGAGTFAANGILFGNGTSAIGATAVGTATHVLTSNGTGVAPTFQATGSITAATENFTDTTNYTSGSTTTLTLLANLASENDLHITFDGVTQHHNTYSIAGTPSVITFDTAIPTGTDNIEAQYGTTSAAAGGGAMEFISKTTISGTPSSIDVTGLDDDSVYKIIFPYVTLSTSTFPRFKMYDHSDTLISADYSYRREDSSVLTVASGGTDMNAYGALGTTWNAEFTLVTKAGSASFYMQQFAPTGNDSDEYCRVSGGFDDTLYASGIGGLSLYPGSGTFTGGQYRIYKLKDS